MRGVFEGDGRATPPVNRIDYVNGEMDIRSDREGGTKVAMALSSMLLKLEPNATRSRPLQCGNATPS